MGERWNLGRGSDWIPDPWTLIRVDGASVKAYPAPGDNAMAVAKYENGQSVYEDN